MQLLANTPSIQPKTAEQRLAQALRLESYFRALLSESHCSEVLEQWNASHRLVTRALTEYIAWYGRPPAA